MSTSVSSSSRSLGDTASPAASRAGTAGQIRRARRWIVLFAALAMVGIGFLVIRVQGSVSGVEFSPTHFQQREFSFYEIPLIGVQITPIRRSGVTSRTELYVRQNLLARPTSGTSPRWHLVAISRGFTGTTEADASLLVDQLTLDSIDQPDYWRKWSINHPNEAKLLWPLVQRLAERELYVLIPSLFELAQFSTSADDLGKRIDAHLPAQYAQLVSDMRSADRDDLADQLLSEAMSEYPDHPALTPLGLPSP